jgi:hypothetical protein
MNAIEMMEAFGNGGYDEESNDFMIDSLSHESSVKKVMPSIISEDKIKIQDLAYSYYKIKKDQSGWSQHRANVVNQISKIFKANAALDGLYNLNNKTCFQFISEGKSSLIWGQKEKIMRENR